MVQSCWAALYHSWCLPVDSPLLRSSLLSWIKAVAQERSSAACRQSRELSHRQETGSDPALLWDSKRAAWMLGEGKVGIHEQQGAKDMDHSLSGSDKVTATAKHTVVSLRAP